MNRRHEWAQVLSAAAGDGDRWDVLPTAVRLSEDVAPAMVGASVTELAGPGARTPVSVNELALALALDQAQYEDDRGPCMDAARHQVPQRVSVADAGARYPLFTSVARRFDVRGSLSLPLVGGRHPAALNLYASDAAAFDDPRSRAVADLLARCVAALIRPDHRPDGLAPGVLAAALARRDRVRQAQDALVARDGGDRQDALDELVRRSRTEGLSIHAVARAVLSGPSGAGSEVAS